MDFKIKNDLLDRATGVQVEQKPEQGESVSIFARLKDKIDRLDEKAQVGIAVFSPVKKTVKTINQIADGNPFLAALTVARGINDLPQDIRLIKKGLTPGPNLHWNEQKPFDMIPGTLLEKTPVAKLLKPVDKNLFDLTIVKKGLLKAGMKGYEVNNGYYKINGSAASKVLGGAALRTPILYLGMAGALELPNIFKAEDKPKAAIRAAINVGLGSYLWSILGCIGRFYGPLPEFVFAGLGAILGRKISNFVADLLLGKEKKAETVMP